jgi:acyl-CoA synthetase (AMP-forming)/AMP-acid ligase II
VGLGALAGGIYLVAANRPPVMSESAPRRPVTQPLAETLAATGAQAGGLIGAVGTSEPPGEPIAIAAHVAGIVETVEATVGADGWLRSGDAGYLDEDGYLYIHDRVKDMIISGAENIYPAEVESAVYGHPHVAEVAVIGVPDDKWGEAVKAIVAPKPGVTPDAEDIIAFARTRIAAFKANTTNAAKSRKTILDIDTKFSTIISLPYQP